MSSRLINSQTNRADRSSLTRSPIILHKPLPRTQPYSAERCSDVRNFGVEMNVEVANREHPSMAQGSSPSNDVFHLFPLLGKVFTHIPTPVDMG